MNEIGIERMKPFRSKLKKLREEKGYSQRELALRCGIDHSKISELENVETSNLYLTTLFEIAKGLEVEPKELLEL